MTYSIFGDGQEKTGGNSSSNSSSYSVSFHANWFTAGARKERERPRLNRLCCGRTVAVATPTAVSRLLLSGKISCRLYAGPIVFWSLSWYNLDTTIFNLLLLLLRMLSEYSAGGLNPSDGVGGIDRSSWAHALRCWANTHFRMYSSILYTKYIVRWRE